MGRYHHYRLHPLSVSELNLQTDKDMKDLFTLGGFPEPFLSGSEEEARRWARNRNQQFFLDDIRTLENVQDLSKMEGLIYRLPRLVGSPLSLNALRLDLQVAHKTLAKWLNILEQMYLIFRVPPFSKNHLRSQQKAQKHYHYNWAEVKEAGARFENLVASHLLKWVHLQQDRYGENIELRYFRTRDQKEVDFYSS